MPASIHKLRAKQERLKNNPSAVSKSAAAASDLPVTIRNFLFYYTTTGFRAVLPKNHHR